MKNIVVLMLLIIALVPGLVSAQTPGGSSVLRLDPALDAIVSPNARVEILKGDYFGNAEGPVWVKQGGYLLFSDIGANKIYKWISDGKLSMFLDRAGFNGPDAQTRDLGAAGYVGGYNGRLYSVSFGPNGLAIDDQGRLVWCAQGDRGIVRLEKDGKTRTVLADTYEGKRLNRPNDLVLKSDGWVYFTDPHSNNAGAGNVFPGRVYRVKEPGSLQLLIDNIQPNGIALSPDEKYLYIGGSKLTRYDMKPDGTVANPKEVNSVGCDGMRIDPKGFIYCATGEAKGVRILTAEGKHLGTILTPMDNAGPNSLAFGGPDGKTLYLTVKRSLAKVRLNTSGFRGAGSN